MVKNDKSPVSLVTAELIVRNLEAHGVKHVFGIPGAKVDRIFNVLVDSPIEVIAMRHEQNAAFVAAGMGRLTGKAGVAITTSGPGVSNLTTGLATATAEGDAMIAIGGAVGRDSLPKLTHQSMDTVSMLRPVTKYSVEMAAPNAASEIISNAFRAAESGRPGAAFVSVPMDVLNADAQAPVLAGGANPGEGVSPAKTLAGVAELVNKAKKPVLLLGMLASREENVAGIREFVKASNIPAAGCYQAAGALSSELLPLFGGRVGLFHNQEGDWLLDEADLVIAIGYNPVEYDPNLWNTKVDRPLINIDVVPAMLDNYFAPDAELIGDIGLNLHELSKHVKHHEIAPEISRVLQAYRQRIDSTLKASYSPLSGTLHPLQIVNALRPFVGQDVTITMDMGSFHIWIARYLEVFNPGQMLISNGQQTMGVGLPWGIAANIVNPSQKVISISGDGGFMMSAMELETAVRLKSNVVHLIWADEHYNMVRLQEEKKYGRDAAVAFGGIDFAQLAQSMGAHGINVTTEEELKSALNRAMSLEGPVVIAIPVDYKDNASLLAPLPALSGGVSAHA